MLSSKTKTIGLVLVLILTLSAISVVDFAPNYNYETQFSAEKVSANEIPENVESVNFDSLSDSEKTIVLDHLRGDANNFDQVSDSFDREGYLSINNQLYEYETVNTVSSPDPIPGLLISLILFCTATLIVMSGANSVVKEHHSTEKMVVIILVFVLMLGILPASQFIVFNMSDSTTGSVTYVGPADQTGDATEFSSLTGQQQAYVSTLTRKVSGEYQSEHSQKHTAPITMKTNMETHELQELDTIVMQLDGEENYYNFVTTNVNKGPFNLTPIENTAIEAYIATYIVFSIAVLAGVLEEKGVILNH